MGGLKGTVQSDTPRGKELEACIFHVGLVDMLTTYNFKKQIAHTLKSNTIAHWTSEIDTEPPDVYAERFRNYFKRNIFAETEDVKVNVSKRGELVSADLLTFDA